MAERGTDEAAGMSLVEAKALAWTVEGAAPSARLVVEPEGRYWVVQVTRSSAGVFWLRDEDDWAWLRPRICKSL
jgi:hypothetical protein